MNVYDFGTKPATFVYNGLPMHKIQRIEQENEYESITGDGFATTHILQISSYWKLYLTNGDTLTFPMNGVKFTFFKDVTEPGMENVRIECRSEQGVHPKIEPHEISFKGSKPIVINSGHLSLAPPPTSLGRREEVDKLPGIKETVEHPVTKRQDNLESIIIDLNDDHGWTRFQIADWLESLDIDIRFKTKE